MRTPDERKAPSCKLGITRTTVFIAPRIYPVSKARTPAVPPRSQRGHDQDVAPKKDAVYRNTTPETFGHGKDINLESQQ